MLYKSPKIEPFGDKYAAGTCISKTGRTVVVVECIYEPYIFSHSVATSLAECNHCSPRPYSLDCGQLLKICDIVWHLPQGHMSVAARRHFS